MGWQEREYSSGSEWSAEESIRRPRLPALGTRALLVVHLAAFVFMLMLRGDALRNRPLLGVLSGDDLQPLAILTHPIASANPVALLITLILLWVIGGRFEARAGTRRLLVSYVLATLAAGLVFYAVAAAAPALGKLPLDAPTAAFTAWSVLLFRDLSDAEFWLFGAPRKIAHLTSVLVGVLLLFVLVSYRFGALAWLAALVAGGASILVPLPRLAPPRLRLAHRPRVRPSRVTERPLLEETEPDIDAILAKISRSGINSLTELERAQLEAARRARLRAEKDA